MCLFLCAVPIHTALLHINSNLPKSLFYITGASEMGLCSSKDRLYIKGYRQGSQWIYRKEERICKIIDLESIRKDIIGEIKWTSYDYCMARDSLELTRWWKIRFMAEVLHDKRKAKAQLNSLYKQLEEINWAIFRKYMDTYPESPPATSTIAVYTVPHVDAPLCR
ncbi:hypothetical protein XELAEV_18029559mg [Xenopus laevis]|uniref:Uncharacterized protein n=1 Tax=Xenopus laevis TaxID=8355 RepID=A0A974CTI1_XENLA|nr:hypothetical protein XELAEV_18029559mg [Xenopus laevis]